MSRQNDFYTTALFQGAIGTYLFKPMGVMRIGCFLFCLMLYIFSLSDVPEGTSAVAANANFFFATAVWLLLAVLFGTIWEISFAWLMFTVNENNMGRGYPLDRFSYDPEMTGLVNPEITPLSDLLSFGIYDYPTGQEFPLIATAIGIVIYMIVFRSLGTLLYYGILSNWESDKQQKAIAASQVPQLPSIDKATMNSYKNKWGL